MVPTGEQFRHLPIQLQINEEIYCEYQHESH
jgi:hypothetical protein